MFPGDLTIDVLSAAMRGAQTRNSVLAHNLANADTPGYRRLDVQFEGALAEAVRRERSGGSMGPVTSFDGDGGVAGFNAGVRQINTTQIRIDGSNFDADSELAALSSNQLAYQTMVSLLDKNLGQIRSAITG